MRNFMLRRFFFISCTAALLYSCGEKRTTSSGENPTTVTFANPGPTSCSLTTAGFSGKIIGINSLENFQKIITSPLQSIVTIKNIVENTTPIQAKHHPQAPRLQLPLAQNNLKITGGDTVPSSSNCHANNAGASTVVSNNTVAIVIPASGLIGTDGKSIICSGALVGDGNGNYLILTAAHCFNEIADYKDATAGGAKVYFTNNLQAVNNVITSTAYSTVSCWQRHPYYHNIPVSNTDFSTSLFDIAWIKLQTPSVVQSYGYSPASILTSIPLSSKEEKLMAGFGSQTDTGDSDGYKRCTSASTSTSSSTSLDVNYANRGDIIPATAQQQYDSYATAYLGNLITNFTTTASETYLNIVGPINGNSSIDVAYNAQKNHYYASGPSFGHNSAGTCYGDSGGPLYAYHSQWTLAALTEGSDNLITPHPKTDFTASSTSGTLNNRNNFNFNYAGLCADGYGIYTNVSSHLQWIEASSGRTLTKQ